LTKVDDAQPQARLVADTTTGHEANNLRVRGLIGFAAALVGVTVLVLCVLTLVMHGFLREEKQLESMAQTRFAGDTGEYPAPRIQADTADELTKMKADDLGRLNNYGWIDRKAGVAHIPVDRAIEILAEKGLPGPEARGVKPAESGKKEPAAEIKEQSKPGSGRGPES
jgi:hypothetical protein